MWDLLRPDFSFLPSATTSCSVCQKDPNESLFVDVWFLGLFVFLKIIFVLVSYCRTTDVLKGGT